MRAERVAHGVGPGRIDIAYERRGRLSDPPVLLVMGIAAQMVHWQEGFLDALLDRGLQVIRFDNRDSGHSTHLDDAPVPDLAAALAGDLSSAAYRLSDMAADTVGLADALGVDSVHLVGASMGGAIAQVVAIEHPGRVRSLTSMMSTTGDMAVGQPDSETMRAVFGMPPARSRATAVEQAVRRAELLGSPTYPMDAEAVARTAAIAYDRDHDVLAVARQAVATVASGDRSASLGTLELPALVIHGTADLMCDVSGGRATAVAIPGAELVLIDGMGHNLPPGVWERVADAIAGIVARGEAG
jgi:pimeloyl-ACP methyl ester carboxylesterase